MKIPSDKRFRILIGFGLSLALIGDVSSCRLDEFRCLNGNCISSEFLCDGKKECADGSDETRSQCLKPEITCPVFAFRCDYGACIDGDVICDGQDDCADRSDETLPQCASNDIKPTNLTGCGINQFICSNGQCIDSVELCDGSPDCNDRSDETAAACQSIECEAFTFRCKYGACIDHDFKCNGVRNCADGSDEDPTMCRSSIISSPRPAEPTPEQSIPESSNSNKACPLPPQILHGYYKLHPYQCANNDYCDPSPGMVMTPGTRIVYLCYAGYTMKDSGDVFCVTGGNWSELPKCEEIRCPKLRTPSTDADCIFEGNSISCENPVPPRTQATLRCRTSYRSSSSILQRDRVTCNSYGKWDPQPITCVPVCGVKPPNVRPLIVHGSPAKPTEFPWHATIYEIDKATKVKSFICGATIIKDDLLITAAHCVFDEGTGTLQDANTFAIAAGNFFKDYDYQYPPPIVVRKANVTNIHMPCNFQGFAGNYDRDIAILQIEPPLIFTSNLLPICLDAAVRRRAVDSGTYGSVAGFGKTEDGTESSILQSLTMPVIPGCAVDNLAPDLRSLITLDKFCAGYTNGSSVCEGDSGGGLVFKTQDLWYLRGIVSVGMIKKTGGVRSCDSFQVALYTEVVSHMDWIQDILSKLANAQRIPSCKIDSR